jgi:DNA-binding response OmpR family regulator
MAETRRKILCIEDDREAAALIAEDLLDRGFDVCVAHDGEKGINAILSERPDLVVCDVNMPILSGFQVAERVAALAPDIGDIPFVFLTAMSDRDAEITAQKFGTYLAKPIDFDELNLIINGHFADRARSDARMRIAHADGHEVEDLSSPSTLPAAPIS